MEPISATITPPRNTVSVTHNPKIGLHDLRLDSQEDICLLFPSCLGDIARFKENALKEASEAITDASTFYVLDCVTTLLHTRIQTLEVLILAHPSDRMREEARQTKMELAKFLEKRLRLKTNDLELQIIELENQFVQNIDEDDSHIWLTEQELAGVEYLEFENGRYKVTSKQSTNIMASCDVEETRQRLFDLRVKSAWPANQKILDQLVECHQLQANARDRKSFADLNIEDQMAQSLQKIEAFLDEVGNVLFNKAKSEYDEIVQNLPQGISLTPQKKIKAWDLDYLLRQRLNRYALDEECLKPYFPFDQVLQETMAIFSKKLSLNIQKVAVNNLWDSSIIALQVGSLGYILLDLWYRKDKFSGGYCFDVVPPRVLPQGYRKPGLAVVVTNLGPAKSDMCHTDIVALFHELGHAFHHLIGTASLPSQCGYHVKKDFLEFPAMLFEELAWEPEIIKQLSRQQIPEGFLNNLVSSRYVNAGLEGLMHLSNARFSLDIYKQGFPKNSAEIRATREKQLNPLVDIYPDSHLELSLRHLCEPLYRSLYYTYILNEVYAKDAYTVLKQQGQKGWDRLISYILSRGGEGNPLEMLTSFLQRQPNSEAYFRSLSGQRLT